MKHIASITTLTLVAAAAMADAAPAVAPASAWTQSGNLAITSNYIWRGVSQNNNSVGISGGYDVAHTSGLSAGVWFASAGDGYESQFNLENDVYANYAFKVSGVDLSVGYIAYIYQGNSSANFSEVNVSATFAGVTAKVSKEITNGANVNSPSTLGEGFTNFGYYYELGYTYSIPAIKGLDLGLHYGWADVAGSSNTNEDYSVSLTYPVAGFAATLAYSNTPGVPRLAGNGVTAVAINGGLYAISLKKTF
jgi:uncharacterized protein (TIGR02001 family)